MSTTTTTPAPAPAGQPAPVLAHPGGTRHAHPFALLVPRHTPVEFADIKDKIQRFGFMNKHPIVLLDGLILDGLGRYGATVELGVEPVYREYDPATDGPDPLEFVTIENIARRHLNASQRAAYAVNALPFYEEEARKRQEATRYAKTETPAAPSSRPSLAAAPTPSAPKSAAPAASPPAAGGAPVIITEDEAEEQEIEELGAGGGGGADPTPKADTKAPGAGKTAAQLVAEKYGTSETMVRLSKRVAKYSKATGTDLHGQTLRGEVSVAEAMKIVEPWEAAEKEKNGAGEEKRRWDSALVGLGDKYGMDSDIYIAVKGGKFLKKADDLEQFVNMRKDETPGVVRLLILNWDLKKARKFLDGEITLENSLEDLINEAIARGKDGEYTVTVNGWVISLKNVA